MDQHSPAHLIGGIEDFGDLAGDRLADLPHVRRQPVGPVRCGFLWGEGVHHGPDAQFAQRLDVRVGQAGQFAGAVDKALADAPPVRRLVAAGIAEIGLAFEPGDVVLRLGGDAGDQDCRRQEYPRGGAGRSTDSHPPITPSPRSAASTRAIPRASRSSPGAGSRCPCTAFLLPPEGPDTSSSRPGAAR